jgi:hypothetical protein
VNPGSELAALVQTKATSAGLILLVRRPTINDAPSFGGTYHALRLGADLDGSGVISFQSGIGTLAPSGGATGTFTRTSQERSMKRQISSSAVAVSGGVTLNCGTQPGGGTVSTRAFSASAPATTSSTTVSVSGTYSLAPNGDLFFTSAQGTVTGVASASGGMAILGNNSAGAAHAHAEVRLLLRAPSNASLSSLKGTYNVQILQASAEGSDELRAETAMATFDGIGGMTLGSDNILSILRDENPQMGTATLSFGAPVLSGGTLSVPFIDFKLSATSKANPDTAGTYAVTSDGTVTISLGGGGATGYLSADGSAIGLWVEKGIGVALKRP